MRVVSEGASLYHMDLSMVADGNSAIEHNVPQSELYDDVLQFWSQTKVAYTPTLVVTYGGMPAEDYWYMATNVWEHPILSKYVPPDVLQPRSVRRTMAPEGDFYHFTNARTAKQLADAGVIVTIGAHGQREGLAAHWELWGFAQGGMSPVEVLKRGTVDAAKKLGMFERPRLARGRQARRPRDPRREPARGHLRHRQGAARDAERAAVRSRDARRGRHRGACDRSLLLAANTGTVTIIR